METLRLVVVFIHLIGFAVLFGAWAAQAFGGSRQITKIMDYGLAIAGVSWFKWARFLWPLMVIFYILGAVYVFIVHMFIWTV